jgi:hypothetical protein
MRKSRRSSDLQMIPPLPRCSLYTLLGSAHPFESQRPPDKSTPGRRSLTARRGPLAARSAPRSRRARALTDCSHC